MSAIDFSIDVEQNSKDDRTHNYHLWEVPPLQEMVILLDSFDRRGSSCSILQFC